MTADEVKKTLEGATITHIEVTDSADGHHLWAFQLKSGSIFMFRTDWDGLVSIEEEYREGVWFLPTVIV